MEDQVTGIRALVAAAIPDPELRAAYLECETAEQVQALIAAHTPTPDPVAPSEDE